MDDVSNGGIGSTPYNNSQSFGSLTYQINPNCLKCNNYGNADYDIRISFNGILRLADAVQVQQQLCQRSIGWLDAVGELLLALGPATLGH